MIWGEIKEQPRLFQVLKTTIKLYVQIKPYVSEELKTTNPPIGVTLVCEDLNGMEYNFRQGTEIQKVQIKKDLASFKVLINPITKLKKETLYNPFLPLHPSARKAKPRFWLRIFWGNYQPLNTNTNELIKQDESVSASSTESIQNQLIEVDIKHLSILSNDPPPDFASLKSEGAFVEFKRKDQLLKNGKEESMNDLKLNNKQNVGNSDEKKIIKPIVFKPIRITNVPVLIMNPLLLPHLMNDNIIFQSTNIPSSPFQFTKSFLSLHQKIDPVQICTQVIKPHISLKINRDETTQFISEGLIDIELIWSFKTEKNWKTVVIPNGLYYETTKNFSYDTNIIVFKHAHLNNWTIIKNFVKNHLPKSLWKENFLKHHYGFRFHIRTTTASYGYIEIPFLFQIDIRRENDPNYIPKGKRSLNEKCSSNESDISSSPKRKKV